MQKRRGIGKRLIAMVLAAVMMLSTTVECFAATVTPKTGTDEAKPTTTLGQLIVDNYSFDEAAKELITSGWVPEACVEYIFEAPDADNGNGTVEIDPDNFNVTVEPYTYKDGDKTYTWKPVKAVLHYGEGTTKDIELTENAGSYTGSFEDVKDIVGNSYNITVTYKMYITAAADAVDTLLGAPEKLFGAKDAVLSAYDGAVSMQSMLTTDISGMSIVNTLNLNVTYGYELIKLLLGDGILGVTVTDDKGDIGEIVKQVETNGTLTLKTLAGNYVDAKGVKDVAGLCDKYIDLKTESTRLYNATVLLNAKLSTMSAFFGEFANACSSAVDDLKKANDYKWSDLHDFLNSSGVGDLDELVNALTAEKCKYTAGDEVTVNDEGVTLLADTTDVIASVAQGTVTVKFVAEVYEENKQTSTLKTVYGTTLKVPVGSTAADVAKLITDEDTALTKWKEYDVNTTNYKRSTASTIESAVEENGEYTYTITYTPKEYDVDCVDFHDDDIKDKYEYGYYLLLPELNDGSGNVYDYKVNDENKDEGTYYRIVGKTTITRAAGKAWESHDIGELLVNNYASDDAHAKAILESAALNTGSVRLRTPGDSNNLLSITGNTLKAENYKANTTDSLVWKPVKATLVGGKDTGAEIEFNDGNTVDLSGYGYDSVTVTYQLELDWIDLDLTADKTLELLNLPKTLADAAKKQMDAMQLLADQSENINTINNNLALIRSTIKGADDVQQGAKDAIDNVYNSCTNEDKTELKVYKYVTDYANKASDGAKLAYYYENCETIANEVKTLYGYLSTVLSDEAVQDLIRGNEQTAPYYDKIDGVMKELNTASEDMTPVDGRISITSARFTELTTAIVDARDKAITYDDKVLKDDDAQEKTPVLKTTLSVDAPNKVSIAVVVNVLDKDGRKAYSNTESKSYDVNYTLTDEDSKELLSWLHTLQEENVKAAGYNVSYYDYSSSGTGDWPTSGDSLTASITWTVTLTPQTITVPVEGENVTIDDITYGDTKVSLPGCDEDGFYYEYTIGDKTLETDANNNYTFTDEEMEKLLKGELTITCTKVNKAEASRNNYFNSINGTTGTPISFAPLKQGDTLKAVVMRIDWSAIGELDMLSFANTLIGTDLTIDNFKVVADGKISIGALINALLSSGVSMDSILEAIDASGDLNQLTLEKIENDLSASEPTTFSLRKLVRAIARSTDDDLAPDAAVTTFEGNYGAEIGQSSIVIGSDNSNSVPLYITLQMDSETARGIRNKVAAASEYLEVSAEGGALNIKATAPDAVWAYALAGLSALGKADLNKISAVNASDVANYLSDKLLGVINSEGFSLKTIDNTMAKYGQATNLDGSFGTAYGNYAEYLKAALKVQWTGEDDTPETASSTVSAETVTLLQKLGEKINLDDKTMTAIKGLIAENDKITVPLNVTITNITKPYAAMVVTVATDTSAVSLAKTIQLVTKEDFETYGLTIGSKSLAILLSEEVEGNVTFTGDYAALDLNGNKLEGKVDAGEGAGEYNYLVDSTLNNAGVVTGTIDSDVVDARTNGYYTISENDGTITVKLTDTVNTGDSDSNLDNANTQTAWATAVELASDLLLNYYNKAQKLSIVEGDTEYVIYNVSYTNLSELFDGISTADGTKLLNMIELDGINCLANKILNSLLQFNTKDGSTDTTNILDLKLRMYNWDVTVKHNTDDGNNYLDIGIGTATKLENGESVQQYKEYNLSIQRSEDEAIFDELGKIVDNENSSANVNLETLTVEGTTITLSGNGNLSLSIDMSENHAYAVALAVAAAAQGYKTTDLHNAVNEYYGSGKTDISALKTAVESLTDTEIIATIKSVTRQTNFTQKAIEIGVKNYAEVGKDWQAMSAVRYGIYGTGWLLGKLESLGYSFNGNDQVLSGYDADHNGTYVLSKEVKENATKEIGSYAGLTLQGKVTEDSTLTVTLKLFADYEGFVVRKDNGDLVDDFVNWSDAIAALADGYALTMYKDYTMDAAATINHSVTIYTNGKTLTQDDNTSFVLVAGKTLMSDNENLCVTTYQGNSIDTGKEGDLWTWKAAQYAVQFINSEGKLSWTNYLTQAVLNNAKEGTTVYVRGDVELSKDLTIKKLIIDAKNGNIDPNGHTITLSHKNAEVIVKTAFADGTIVCGVANEGNYKYTWKMNRGTDYVSYTIQSTYNGPTGGGGNSYTSNYIYLDVQPTGITATQLQTAVRKYLGDSSATVTVYSGLTSSGLVANGTSIYVSGTRGGNYTVIIMGDTNCNGKTDSGDAVMMRNHYFGSSTLTGVALEAADMNRNGKVDSGDAVKNRVKFQGWSSYTSALKITV